MGFGQHLHHAFLESYLHTQYNIFLSKIRIGLQGYRSLTVTSPLLQGQSVLEQ